MLQIHARAIDDTHPMSWANHLKPAKRRQSLPILFIGFLAIALTFLHPLDWVGKNLIAAMIMLICVTVLTLGSSFLLLLRFSASVTALNAAVCLLDILFADGFTNSVGRAAGLAINSNLAGAELLLGAAATYWAVPKRWLIPFLLLVGAAMFVTLSRSTLLAAAVIGCGTGAASLWQMIRDKGSPRLSWARSGRIVLVSSGLLIWVVTAFFTNDRFLVAASDSFAGLTGAVSAFEEASRPVRAAMQSVLVQGKTTMEFGAEAERQRALQDALVEAQIRAIGKEHEGEKNSVADRALVMWRALIVYETGPFFGRGLATAHAIAPHNTFLLFAVAFGHLGWLVPLLLIGLTLYRVRNPIDLPLGLATTAVLMTSHDILFPSLIVPVAIGIAGLISKQIAAKVGAHSIVAVRCVAGAALIFFTIGCWTVIARFDHYMTVRLGTGAATIQQGPGQAFAVRIPSPEFCGVLRIADVASQISSGSNLLLLEDGKALSDVQATDNAVMELGRGRYVVWRRNTLIFSTSDNSDPRFNGRVYEIRVPVSIHPLIFLVLGIILIWCVVVVSKLRAAQVD